MPANLKHAHNLLDQLGPGQLAAVIHLLETMVSPDQDALSETERKAIAEADDWLTNHEPISHEYALADLGLTLQDWDTMCEDSPPETAPPRNG